MKNVIDLVVALREVNEFNRDEVARILTEQEWIRHEKSDSPAEEWRKGELSTYIGFEDQEFPVSILCWDSPLPAGGLRGGGLDALYSKAREVVEELRVSLQGYFQEQNGIEYSRERFSDLDYFDHHSWRAGSRTIHLGAIQYDTDLPVIVEVYVT